MPLTHQHQLTILADILTNHQTDCTGTASECEQVQRLAKILKQNNVIAPEIRQILEQIEEYSTTGAQQMDLLNHIETHQPNLSQWVNTINHYH